MHEPWQSRLRPSRLSEATRAVPVRTQFTILAIAAAVGILLLVVVPLIRSHWAIREEAAAPAAPGTFRPTDAQWAGLKLATVESVTFRTEQVTDGKIAIDEDFETPVFSPYSGRVTRLLAKPGDFVERSTPLMAVEAVESVQGQNDLLAAVAALNKARSQLRLTEINEKRQRELYESKAGALKDWQQAQADLAAARSDQRTAETLLAAARNRLRILGKSDSEVTALEAAGTISAEAIVSAPIAGTVIQRKVGIGQYINSGASDPVFAIGDLTRVWLIGNVRETDAPLMHVGDPVEVRVLAFPGRVFKAKLTYVAPSVDPNTHRLLVRAEVENADGALKPEMFASFSIITGSDSAAPAVPEDAVIYEGNTARVWVARPDKSLASRSIRTGRVARDGMVEVLAGLEPGETIVTSGTLFIDRASKGD